MTSGRVAFWWFRFRLFWFYRLVRLGLWMMPERHEDWFLTLLEGRIHGRGLDPERWC